MHIGRQEALNTCMNAIEYAKDHGLFDAFSAEDATRTDLDFLKRIYNKAESYSRHYRCYNSAGNYLPGKRT